jgi:hypothetical protein
MHSLFITVKTTHVTTWPSGYSWSQLYLKDMTETYSLINPPPLWLTERHFIEKFQPQVEKLNPRKGVSSAKKEGKGRNLCIGVQITRQNFVWILASRFSTQRRTSKFGQLLVVSLCTKLNCLWAIISIMYKGWSKISGTEFIVGKQKHLQVTRIYLLQSTTLQIVCSKSSDPSTFQCMSGRFVWEWAYNCHIVFSCTSTTSWNRSPFRVLFSLGKRKKSQGAKSGE